MNAVQPSLSSPRTSRIIFWLGVALLIAAVVVFVIKRDHGSSSAAPSKAAAAAKADGLNPTILKKDQRQPDIHTTKTWAQLDPAAKVAAKSFIFDGAGEKNLARAWQYTAPSIKQGFTKHQWVHGNELPFQVYPELDPKIPPSFTLVEWSPRSFTAQVGLASTQKTGRGAYTFQIGAVKVGTGAKAHWLVNYWNALYTPPVRADPSQSFGG
jgi:hypothetical protein